MPWADGVFSRIWKFVDHFTVGQDITREDLDIALDDLADGINSYQYEVTDADLQRLADTGYDAQVLEILTPAREAADAAAATANSAAETANTAAANAKGFTFRGQRVDNIPYRWNDVVLDNASLYVAKVDMGANIATSSTPHWDVMLPRGKGWSGVSLNASNQLVFSSDDGLGHTTDSLTPDLDAAVTAAEKWAEEEEDTEVDTGQYSALHHAAKAAASKTAAESAKTGAETARDKAAKWAEEIEDTEVEAGKYSALHHAAKAEIAKTAAETAKGQAETARDAATVNANATAWGSGGSYTAGENRYSLINYHTFRCTQTHSGRTADPSVDGDYWIDISGATPEVLSAAANKARDEAMSFAANY